MSSLDRIFTGVLIFFIIAVVTLFLLGADESKKDQKLASLLQPTHSESYQEAGRTTWEYSRTDRWSDINKLADAGWELSHVGASGSNVRPFYVLKRAK